VTRIDGRQFETRIATDLDQDGVCLEVSEDVAGTRRIVLEIVYSYWHHSMTFSAFERGIPLSVVEYAVAEASRRLVPRSIVT
jgi:hypothetical protein